MTDPACLYVLLEAPRARNEQLLRDLVTPLAERWRHAPGLDSLFFVRYSEPTWQLRFRLLGRPEWIAAEARPRVAEAVAPLLAAGVVERVEYAVYDREIERYGGPAGMRLAERLFHCDSLACLDWLALERAGRTRWSRREFALALVERYADGFGFDEDGRREFDRNGFQWAFDTGVWGRDERSRLDETFERNRRGLAALLDHDPPLRGTAEEHAVVDTFRAAAAPALDELVRGLAAGAVRQHPPYLAWSLTHMFTNRMGIDPAGEAVLRYMAYRRHGGPALAPVAS